MAIKDQILPLVNSFHSGPGPQTFGSTSPASRSFQQPNSPGPNNHDPYVDHGYGQTTSPQPSGIQVNVNRVIITFFKIILIINDRFMRQ